VPEGHTMQLKAVRIKNFRTISDEVTFQVSRKCALIGINNVGKSNILHAIHLFFSYQPPTITNRIALYSRKSDFPFSASSGRTTINLMFDCEDNDEEILSLYNGIKKMLAIPIGVARAISVLLVFSETGKPTYQIFPGKGRPSSAHDLEQVNGATSEFFDEFFRKFAVHYLRSDKRVAEIYHELILPSVKQEIAEGLSSVYETIKSSIGSVNSSLNSYMNDIGLSPFSIRLSAPEDVAELIQEIKFRVEDEGAVESELDSKGMGIQVFSSYCFNAMVAAIL
jgi:hypothetical protein